MEGRQSLTQRDHEIVAIALTCLENTDIDFKMLAERGGYKNANSAREGFRVAKKKLLAFAGVNAGSGRLPASDDSHPTAASSSTTGTSARTQPTRAQPTRVQPARASSGRAAPSAPAARATSARKPSVRTKSTRVSSTRTIPAKRSRRGVAASPSTSEEEAHTSNDIEDSDHEMEGDDEEDYKPSRTRRPLTKKAKTSAETKVSNNESPETADPEELDEHDYHGDDEATGYDKEPSEESNAVAPNLLADPKEHGSMNDNSAGEGAQIPDEKRKEESKVVVPVFNTETEEKNSMGDNNAGEDAQAPDAKPSAVSSTLHADPEDPDSKDDQNAGKNVQAAYKKPEHTHDVAIAHSADAKEDGKAMSVATKPTAETTQYQGVGHQTKGIHQEMEIAMGETKEDAVVGAEQGVDNKAVDPVVLDDMAGILMQAAALEAQMKTNEESASKESKA